MSDKFTHFDNNGNAQMVDVSDKKVTRRTAAASCRVLISTQTRDALAELPKGGPAIVVSGP